MLSSENSDQETYQENQPEPLPEGPHPDGDQVTSIIEEVEQERTEPLDPGPAEGDMVNRFIEEELEEPQDYEEFMTERTSQRTKFRGHAFSDKVLEIAGEMTDFVDAGEEVFRFDIDEINTAYDRRKSELEDMENSPSSPAVMDKFNGSYSSLLQAEVGIALGMAIAEEQNSSSVGASVNYDSLAEAVDDNTYWLEDNIREGYNRQTEAYTLSEEGKVENVPDSLKEEYVEEKD